MTPAIGLLIFGVKTRTSQRVLPFFWGSLITKKRLLRLPKSPVTTAKVPPQIVKVIRT